MSKTKKTGATHYEILFIIPNKFTDDEAKTVAGQAEKIISEAGGQITLREYWGRKRLAYPIKQNAFGYYGLFEFDLEGASLGKIDQALRLASDILRHQIVVKKILTEEEIARAKKIKGKIDSKKAETEKKREEKTRAAAPAAVKSPAKKTDPRDLDEKLEDILSAKDLI